MSSTLNLAKGQSINLAKDTGIDLSKGSGKLIFGLGWTGINGRTLDLDSFVTTLDDSGKSLDFVYFSNLRSTGIKHNGDDLVGGGNPGDPNETIDIELNKLPSNVKTVVVGLFVYTRGSTLSKVEEAFSDLTTPEGHKVCSFNLKEDFSKYKSVEVARATRNSNGEWEYTATGIGSSLNFSGIQGISSRGSKFDMNSSPIVSGAKGFFGRLFS
jgi:tellurium resistance protein TerZ